MPDLSVIIPGRNEQYLARTVRGVLEASRADTEVIAVCDEDWPDPPVDDDPRVTLVRTSAAIGQRAATNLGARLSRAPYVMKLDAHCLLSDGFDAALLDGAAALGPDAVQVLRMYNLHAFDRVCGACGHREYQGPLAAACPSCQAPGPFRQEDVWQRRERRMNDFALFGPDLRFGYWGSRKHDPAATGDYPETMSLLGAMFFLSRERYWALGGLDEAHGSWGQCGTEVACKAWLSGGRLVVNRRGWFAHLFRTQPGFSFPYPQSQSQIDRARERSRDLWLGGTWEGTRRPLRWLVDRFWPVPGWTEAQREALPATLPGEEPAQVPQNPPQAPRRATIPTRGVVYYSDCRPDPWLLETCRVQLLRAMGDIPLVSVTLRPVPGFGRNLVLDAERGPLTMFRQILAGLEALETDIAYLAEHDVLYAPEHFALVPDAPGVYHYNQATWKVDVATGRAVHYRCNQTSGLCAWRETLVAHYRARVAAVEAHGFGRGNGFEPGTRSRARGGYDDLPFREWMASRPNIDLRHGANLTRSRWSPDEFRDKRHCQGWTEADAVPGWGRTAGRMAEFIHALET